MRPKSKVGLYPITREGNCSTEVEIAVALLIFYNQNMLKNKNPKFTKGSLFICSKCGKDFFESAPERAEKLKTDLRSELKSFDAHTKVRVMVGGCLGVCVKDEQTFAYYPNYGEMELFTTSNNFETAKSDILQVIKTKV